MDYKTIVAQEHDPGRLERLYGQDPVGFAEALPDALASRPHSLVLQAWAERLHAARTEQSHAAQAGPLTSALNLRELLPLALVAVVVGALLILAMPDFQAVAYGVVPDMRPFSLLGLLPTLAVCGLLLYWRGWPRERLWLPVAGLVLLQLAKSAALYGAGPEIGVLADYHLSMLTFFIIGLSYFSGHWLGMEGWKRFVRFYGEVLAWSVLLSLGVGVLVVLGVCLFALWDVQPMLYLDAIILVAMALSLASYWLAFRLDGSRLMPLAAMVLTPAVAIMLALYPLGCLFLPQHPVPPMFPALDSVLYLVAVLLALCLAVYCVIGLTRKGNRLVEYSLLAMVVLAVSTGIPALVEFLGWLKSMPFSYVILAVSVGMLLLFGHLTALGVTLVFKVLGRLSMDQVESVTVRWMPMYLVWCLFMGLVAPWLF